MHCIESTMAKDYSIPEETHRLLWNGIVLNSSQRNLPSELGKAAEQVTFTGSSRPSIPINWRFAESIAALKGFEAAMINVLLKKRFSSDYRPVTINTYARNLFIVEFG